MRVKRLMAAAFSHNKIILITHHTNPASTRSSGQRTGITPVVPLAPGVTGRAWRRMDGRPLAGPRSISSPQETPGTRRIDQFLVGVLKSAPRIPGGDPRCRISMWVTIFAPSCEVTELGVSAAMGSQ
jgi:hypothetical protein